MTVMNVRRLIPAAALSAAAVLGLSACSGSGTGTTKDGKLDVVASFYRCSTSRSA